MKTSADGELKLIQQILKMQREGYKRSFLPAWPQIFKECVRQHVNKSSHLILYPNSLFEYGEIKNQMQAGHENNILHG